MFGPGSPPTLSYARHSIPVSFDPCSLQSDYEKLVDALHRSRRPSFARMPRGMYCAIGDRSSTWVPDGETWGFFADKAWTYIETCYLEHCVTMLEQINVIEEEVLGKRKIFKGRSRHDLTTSAAQSQGTTSSPPAAEVVEMSREPENDNAKQPYEMYIRYGFRENVEGPGYHTSARHLIPASSDQQTLKMDYEKLVNILHRKRGNSGPIPSGVYCSVGNKTSTWVSDGETWGFLLEIVRGVLEAHSGCIIGEPIKVMEETCLGKRKIYQRRSRLELENSKRFGGEQQKNHVRIQPPLRALPTVQNPYTARTKPEEKRTRAETENCIHLQSR
ncbi:hypothetical protein LTR37_016693 [Vermiconidia calcicola]|uniref:Uncharacterized protein n=1 Tax=Vermiconidia calcicola TaxID=1690605 RepID=A0ACC3MMA6_9PEZI|nr:hypothetical protein LTR37_016693 [Vermiconidia calcicola]